MRRGLHRLTVATRCSPSVIFQASFPATLEDRPKVSSDGPRESFTADLSPEYKREIEDRIGQLERGEVEPVEWDAVEARIRATLRAATTRT